MYRSIVASLLLLVLALSQGVSASVLPTHQALGHSFLFEGPADYLQPFVAAFQAEKPSGLSKAAQPDFQAPAFQAYAFVLPAQVSIVHTADHNKTWISGTTTLLYPAHEFS